MKAWNNAMAMIMMLQSIKDWQFDIDMYNLHKNEIEGTPEEEICELKIFLIGKHHSWIIKQSVF